MSDDVEVVRRLFAAVEGRDLGALAHLLRRRCGDSRGEKYCPMAGSGVVTTPAWWLTPRDFSAAVEALQGPDEIPLNAQI